MKFPYQRYEVDPSPIFTGEILYRPEVRLRVIGTAGDASFWPARYGGGWHHAASLHRGGDRALRAARCGCHTGLMPFPPPLEVKRPLGSLIYDPSVSASIGFAGDTDRFTLEVDPGQTMTVVVQSGASLQAEVTLEGPPTPRR